jgi:sulfate permease, SulP family
MEPESPDEAVEDTGDYDGPSMLSKLLRKSPPHSDQDLSSPTPRRKSHENRRESRRQPQTWSDAALPASRGQSNLSDENTPLISRDGAHADQRNGYDGAVDHGAVDEEGQKPRRQRPWFAAVIARDIEARVGETIKVVMHPRKWDRGAIWRNTVEAPISCLPAVTVGLLLNILDALSYGMPDMSPVLSTC